MSLTIDVLFHVPSFSLQAAPTSWLPGLAEAIEKWTEETGGAISIDPNACTANASRLFASKKASGELARFAKTGRSNCRPMQWCRMCISQHMTLPLHAHPNIEFIYVARGQFRERRLKYIPTRGPFADGRALYPVDLATYTASDFVDIVHETNTFVANEIGSIHRSFTLEQGCELLVLWGGCHANVPVKLTPPSERVIGETERIFKVGERSALLRNQDELLSLTHKRESSSA